MWAPLSALVGTDGVTDLISMTLSFKAKTRTEKLRPGYCTFVMRLAGPEAGQVTA
jgi:hypothetical protein